MKETYTDEIEWDYSTFEPDGEGGGIVKGYIRTPGKGCGLETYKAQCKIDESTIEFVSFAENEPEGEE